MRKLSKEEIDGGVLLVTLVMFVAAVIGLVYLNIALHAQSNALDSLVNQTNSTVEKLIDIGRYQVVSSIYQQIEAFGNITISVDNSTIVCQIAD